LQSDAGVDIRVKQEPDGLRLQGQDLESVEAFVDGKTIDVIPTQGDTFFAAASPSQWQNKLVTLRAYRQSRIVGIRNLMLR
jgi:hypothetical protein